MFNESEVNTMKREVRGSQVILDGEPFYKIENFDCMTDFFMTITSSSDIWNFCWAQGGITAGRKNCEYAIFPYYTCDKLQDTKGTTGPVTIIKIKNEGKGLVWQPFENLYSTGKERYAEQLNLQRNIYKNLNGSKVWFEEINLAAGIAYRYGWTSSAKYGLVKMTRIENLTNKKISLEILDGCRNIMSSTSPSEIQSSKSVLLDAYKKSEVIDGANIALISLSSVVTDRAEPSESLTANVCWFSTADKMILSENAVPYFLNGSREQLYSEPNKMKGKRAECYIVHDSELEGKAAECWEQIFDTNYDISKIIHLQDEITQRENAVRLLLADIAETEAKLEANIAAADGIQSTKNKIGDLHHRTNVMFNIMRGGIFYNQGRIQPADFIVFAKHRNKKLGAELESLVSKSALASKDSVSYDELKELVFGTNNPQLKRFFLEYLPLTFSRRHGDPSRPWNRFNIEILDSNGNDKINYEGNWRDIFQNWEALLWSYPEYVQNIVAVFLDTMTVEGFNPYRISRNELDWEVPEKGNPWAQYGYWGDHQVIYLQKLLEFLANYDKEALTKMLTEKVFSTSNLPYRFKSYKEIYASPRNSLEFDYDMDKKLKALEKEYGTDARLILEKDGSVQLTTMTTKIVQLVLAKVLNLIPESGIWMNGQRPEWNDANNALAGFGTSVVTMCYLERMLTFLTDLFGESDASFPINTTVAETLKKAAAIYSSLNKNKTLTDVQRKEFTDSMGLLFEEERTALYANGFDSEYTELKGADISAALKAFATGIKNSIQANKREDNLYHSYNSVYLSETEIKNNNLKLMLEGQVAILSSGLLKKTEKKALVDALRKSDLFEPNQYSYMLYPNSTLPDFMNKNVLTKEDVAPLASLIERTGSIILKKDDHGNYHFNPLFRNADVMKDFFGTMEESKKPSAEEVKILDALYEKIFNHQSFTGRSGGFYAYEGLGCIYWHMVSKLLLAVQENITDSRDDLISFYKDVKKGLGASKTPTEYGAFPFDPYSHTPYLQGAKQPGMTGQVKEEVLTRWGELGLKIKEGKATFDPTFLDKAEFDGGKLDFTWCGTKIVYDNEKAESITVEFKDGNKASFEGNTLPAAESKKLFARTGEIAQITVGLKK